MISEKDTAFRCAAYQNHKVFTLLDDFIDFYKSLSESTFFFMTDGIQLKFPLNIESSIFNSIAGSLDSIKQVLKCGYINDAYALVRKYDDAILTNLFIDCYIKENYSITNFVVKKINDWVHSRERFPNSNNIIDYLKKYSLFKDLNEKLDWDGVYEKIRKRCNDNTHWNSLYFVILNDNECYLSNRIKELNTLHSFILHLFCFHVIYLFTLNQVYMMSSDYIDCLDLGISPEDDLQYEVAPFIQEIFDKYIKKVNKDLVETFKRYTSMRLL